MVWLCWFRLIFCTFSLWIQQRQDGDRTSTHKVYVICLVREFFSPKLYALFRTQVRDFLFNVHGDKILYLFRLWKTFKSSCWKTGSPSKSTRNCCETFAWVAAVLSLAMLSDTERTLTIPLHFRPGRLGSRGRSYFPLKYCFLSCFSFLIEIVFCCSWTLHWTVCVTSGNRWQTCWWSISWCLPPTMKVSTPARWIRSTGPCTTCSRLSPVETAGRMISISPSTSNFFVDNWVPWFVKCLFCCRLFWENKHITR